VEKVDFESGVRKSESNGTSISGSERSVFAFSRFLGVEFRLIARL